MFRDLYAAELEYLYGVAEELGRDQTRIASMLGRDADPGVSRLMQGVAFLSARLRQRLDDDQPDVIHPVIESLRPWLLRPLPSATILELVPDPAMQEPQIARAGSVFASRAVAGASCLFRSPRETTVRPWSLTRVDVANERSEIRLRLSRLPGAAFTTLEGSLRLFFAMPIGAALDLRSILTRSTETVTARAEGGAKAEVALASAGEIVAGRQATSDEKDADPLFALRAYFAWPEQFAFVDIPNLDRLASLGSKVRDFDIVLRLRAPLPASLQLDVASVRLHCVPVVNVRRIPVVTAPLVGRRCALRLTDSDVYSIEKVTLIRDDLSTLAAQPYAQLVPPTLGADGRLPILYRVLRRGSVMGSELDVSLDFVDPEGRGIPADASSVDVELLVTDGDRAAQVGVGDVCVPNSASPPLVSFRNITPVTPSAPPATDDDRLWRWFQLLKANLPSLADRGSLAEAMALANVAAWARWPGCKASPDDLEALLAVRTSRRTRAERAEVFPGVRVDVDVNEGHFASRGDVDLFGECLVGLLASTLQPHEWIELAVHDAAGSLLHEYPRRPGTRVML